MKICKKCGVEKDIDEFRLDKGYRQPSCNTCRLEYSRQYNKKLAKKKKYKLW